MCIGFIRLYWPEIRWPLFDLSSIFNPSLIDDVLWSFLSCIEFIALATTLCCFFLFCGCTL
ncbi:hypothetical protein M569_06119 [Genlisea aurea]|uniref:Uncharacterized protein n=1 Tax=Genlisea aurea TaxID=192259 RepID=S8DZ83_9LAMI|nr:hypothetical protein M569_06119 [Genlisea aurea]